MKVRPHANKAKFTKQTSRFNQPLFVGQYIPAVITTLALAESIGIYGLLLFLLGGDFKTLYTFIIVSALAMIFYRPKREELERLALAYKKQDRSAPAM